MLLQKHFVEWWDKYHYVYENPKYLVPLLLYRNELINATEWKITQYLENI